MTRSRKTARLFLDEDNALRGALMRGGVSAEEPGRCRRWSRKISAAIRQRCRHGPLRSPDRTGACSPARAGRGQRDDRRAGALSVEAARPELRGGSRDRAADRVPGAPGARRHCARGRHRFGPPALPLPAAAKRVIAVEADPALAAQPRHAISGWAPGLAGRPEIIAPARRARTGCPASRPRPWSPPCRTTSPSRWCYHTCLQPTVAAPQGGHGPGRGGGPDERPRAAGRDLLIVVVAFSGPGDQVAEGAAPAGGDFLQAGMGEGGVVVYGPSMRSSRRLGGTGMPSSVACLR